VTAEEEKRTAVETANHRINALTVAVVVGQQYNTEPGAGGGTIFQQARSRSKIKFYHVT